MRAFFTLISIIILSGCASPASPRINLTFQSDGTNYSSLEPIQYAFIKDKLDISDKTKSQVTLAGPSELRIGNIESVIKGSLLKHNISTISYDEFSKLTKDKISRCIIVEWGISGRNGRSDSGYSQEVTVLIKNASSGKLIYKGVGEYMGQTEIDDLKGALFAALKNFGK